MHLSLDERRVELMTVNPYGETIQVAVLQYADKLSSQTFYDLFSKETFSVVDVDNLRDAFGRTLLMNVFRWWEKVFNRSGAEEAVSLIERIVEVVTADNIEAVKIKMVETSYITCSGMLPHHLHQSSYVNWCKSYQRNRKNTYLMPPIIFSSVPHLWSCLTSVILIWDIHCHWVAATLIKGMISCISCRILHVFFPCFLLGMTDRRSLMVSPSVCAAVSSFFPWSV